MAKPLTRLVEDREMEFFRNYLTNNSPTRGNGTKSAEKAGYANPAVAANRILRKYKDLTFSETSEAVGLNNMYLAIMLKRNVDSTNIGPSNSAIKLAKTLRGELDGGGTTENNFNGPTMIIAGEDANAQLKALRTGKPVAALPPIPEEAPDDPIDVDVIDEEPELSEDDFDEVNDVQDSDVI